MSIKAICVLASDNVTGQITFEETSDSKTVLNILLCFDLLILLT